MSVESVERIVQHMEPHSNFMYGLVSQSHYEDPSKHEFEPWQGYDWDRNPILGKETAVRCRVCHSIVYHFCRGCGRPLAFGVPTEQEDLCSDCFKIPWAKLLHEGESYRKMISEIESHIRDETWFGLSWFDRQEVLRDLATTADDLDQRYPYLALRLRAVHRRMNEYDQNPGLV